MLSWVGFIVGIKEGIADGYVDGMNDGEVEDDGFVLREGALERLGADD